MRIKNPTGRHILAQGNALGSGIVKEPALARREAPPSTPQSKIDNPKSTIVNLSSSLAPPHRSILTRSATAAQSTSAFSQAVFPILIAVVITLISDIDRPRRGLIGVSQQPLRELLESMQN